MKNQKLQKNESAMIHGQNGKAYLRDANRNDGLFLFSSINLLAMEKLITSRQNKFFATFALVLVLLFAGMGGVWGQKRNEKDNSKVIKPVESIHNEKELWKKEPFGSYIIENEISERRSANEKHFQRQDGKVDMFVSSEPINFLENGKWKTIYNSIVEDVHGTYVFSNLNNAFKSYYPGNIQDGFKTVINGNELIEMDDAKMYYESNGEKLEIQNINSSLGSVKGNKLTYENVYGNAIDLLVTQNGGKRKLDYVITSRDALMAEYANADYLVFSENIVLPLGWKAKLLNGTVCIFDNSNKLVAYYESPFVYDSKSVTKETQNNGMVDLDSDSLLIYTDDKNNNTVNKLEDNNVHYEIIQNGNVLTISTKVKMDYLFNSQRVFPIVIDPTLTATTGTVTSTWYYSTNYASPYGPAAISTTGAPNDSYITGFSVSYTVTNTQWAGSAWSSNYNNAYCGSWHTFSIFDNTGNGYYSCGGSHNFNCKNPNNTWSAELRSIDGYFYRARYGFSVTVTYETAPSFGSNAWNVLCYAAGDATGGSGAWTNNYRGYYTMNTLNFDTRTGQTNSNAQSWGDGGSPSSALGYQGCSIGVDNHSYIFKRQGFPCGTYQLNLPSHDDMAILLVDGIEVWRNWGCCATRTAVWTGYLGSTSTVELRVSEGGGGSHGALEFVSLPISATVTGTNPTTCGGNGSITMSNVQNGHRSVYQSDFSSTPAGASLSGNASIAGGELTLTAAANSQMGSAVFTPSYRANAWTANYSQFIGGGNGADGMSFTYGPISGAANGGAGGVGGENGWASGLVVSFDTYNGATNSQLNIYWNGGIIWQSAVNVQNFRSGNYVPVKISVNTSNQLSVTWNSINLLTNYALPPAYATADKSAWNYGFSARTGGLNDAHRVSDLYISSIAFLEYSINGTTWSTTNPILAPAGSYTVQARPVGITCPNTNIGSVTLINPNTIDWANLQFPATATICTTGSATVYGRVFKNGYTNIAGADANMTVQVGISSSNTNPNSWAAGAWSAATFNVQTGTSGNDDEYQATLSGLAAGTYYYAFRYRYCSDGAWYYGGYNASGGGFWNGSTNVSGVLTVNQPSTAPTSITGTTTLCSGSNTTLTAAGGSLGTGANYEWGTGSTVGVNPIAGQTGVSITVSPTSTTTYWVRIINSAAPCATTTAGVSTSVTVNQPSVAPTSISGTTTICNGTSTTLTAVGGTLGTGSNYQWGTGLTVGSNVIAGQTGVSISVSPTTATSYWVRIVNGVAPCSATTAGVSIAVTVNQPSTAPTSITGTTTLCNGTSTTLSAAGGSLGTGANYEWGTGAIVGTNPIAGQTSASIMVTPTSTTTYWVRIINSAAPCATTTAGVSTSVTVNQPSVAPTSISGTTTICNGTSTTLTAVGGALGTNAVYEWGTGSTVGSNVIAGQSGVSISVSPTSTTTYWVRIINGTAPCSASTSGVSTSVTVNQPSVAPTTLNASVVTICNGGSTTLTQSGGSLGTGAVWQWYSDANFTTTVGGTLTSSNASLSVSPTSNTTYYLRAINGTTPCAASIPSSTPSAVSVTVTVNPTSVAGTASADQTICSGQTPTALVLIGNTGTIQWQSSTTSTTAGFNDVSSATSSTLTLGSLSATTYYRAIVTSGVCSAVNSNAVTVTVNQPSVNPTSISGNTVCLGASTTLTAVGGSLGIGANYQWGTGSVVGTNPISGATSSTLSVSPTNSTNYWVQIVNGTGPCSASTAGLTTLVTVTTPTIATTPTNGSAVWRGTSSANWTDPSNWYAYNGTYSVATNPPSSSTNVIIPANQGCVTQQPTVISGTVNAKDVTVETGAALTMGTGSVLNVAGNFTINGTGTFTPGTGTETVNFIGNGTQVVTTGTQAFNHVTINGFGTVQLAGNTTINGNYTNNSGSLDLNNFNLTMGGNYSNYVANTGFVDGLVPGTGNVIFNKASGTQTLYQEPGLDFYTIQHTGAGTLQLTSDLSTTGDIINSAGTFDANDKIITVRNNFTNTATFTPGTGVTGEIYFEKIGGTQTLTSGGAVFQKFAHTGTGTLNLSGIVEVKGNVVIDAPISAGTSTLKLSGTGNQTMSGTQSVIALKDMTVAKTAGTVTLSKPVRVDGALTMTQGNIITSATNKLEIGSSTSSLGSVNWTSGNVVGPMRRWFAGATNSTAASGMFPVGLSTVNRYAQVNFTQAPGSGGYIEMEYKAGLPANAANWTYVITPDGQVIQTFEDEGYWDITPYDALGNAYPSGLNTSAFTMKLRANGLTSVNDISVTRIIRSPGPAHTTWEPAGFHLAATGTTADFAIESNTVTGFSWFNIGSPNNNALPVELLNFNGTCEEGMVNLVWQTASEFNSSHFDVEKSTDGETWRVMATIPSAGTSNELLTYQAVDNNGTNGSNYYRLRQVDNDGKEKLYDPINVSCVATTAGYFTSYPNPSGNEFQVVVNNKEILGACTLNIVDAQGKVIDQRSIEVKDGINMFVISEKLNPGIYFLNITNGTKTTQVIKHAVK